jgi:hypothetical protein
MGVCCDNCKNALHYFYVNDYKKILVCSKKNNMVRQNHYCEKFTRLR